MATMMDPNNSIYDGERKTYDAIKNKIPDNVICYFNREIEHKEFDFCLLIKNIGIVIIEVKGWKYTDIISVESDDKIVLKGDLGEQKSPRKQARGYCFSLLNSLQKNSGISPIITGVVCYPFLSHSEFKSSGLQIVSSEDITILSEDLDDSKLLIKKISNSFKQFSHCAHSSMNSLDMQIVRSYFEVVPTPTNEQFSYSRLSLSPNGLSNDKISNIIDCYSRGEKETVFTSSYNDLLYLKDKIEQLYAGKKLLYLNGELLIDEDCKNNIQIKDNKLEVFNFEVYYIENLKEFIDEDLEIIDGTNLNNYYDILRTIADTTSFNLQQYQIEHSVVDKDIQIKAGAGTGKTYSMISRISYLIIRNDVSKVKIPFEQIAMLTFTDEAAVNMRKRIRLQLSNYFLLTSNPRFFNLISNLEKMRISTIHKFANEIIKKTSLPLGIGADFVTISGNYDRKRILEKTFDYFYEKVVKTDENGMIYDLPASIYDLQNFILRFVEKCYNKGVDIKEIVEEKLGSSKNDLMQRLILEVAKPSEIEYSKFLINNNCVNLNDYMIYLNKCIGDDSFNPNFFPFKYIFIDEFQDVDDSQINAFKMLKTKIDCHFFIVGDLKQSIYRFRGSTMDAFKKMGCDGNDWISFSLNKNYRSNKLLLKSYDAIFSKMGKKNLIPYTNLDVLVGVKEGLSSDYFVDVKYIDKDKENGDFYKYLANEINNRKTELKNDMLTKNLKKTERTIAILVRKNSEVSEIVKNMKKYNLIVESPINANLYKLQSTKDLYKLTLALCNPYNVLYLFDFIKSNNVFIEYNEENLIGKNEEQKREDIIKALDQFFYHIMKKKWSDLVYYSQTQPILKVLREIYESTKPWVQYSSDLEAQIYYRINYELLFEDLANNNKRSYLTLDSINTSLNIVITKGLESQSRNIDVDNNGVNIICCTIHASKGLEYDTVIMPFTEGALASQKQNSVEVSTNGDKVGYLFNIGRNSYYNEYFDIKNEMMESEMEESRILYVAMTRAINKFIWFRSVINTSTNWSKLLEG